DKNIRSRESVTLLFWVAAAPFPQKGTAALRAKKHSLGPRSVFSAALAYHLFAVCAFGARGAKVRRNTLLYEAGVFVCPFDSPIPRAYNKAVPYNKVTGATQSPCLPKQNRSQKQFLRP
ncbi:MAG: hypothetical protein IJP03_00735, partial [Christensenellaceae bacterium]|nr:hypothetical protein [Christensenellaceae bacterium]